MKILLGNKGYVDFSSPVFMSVENKEKFISLLKSIFDPSVVIEENIEKFRDWRIGDKIMYPRKWLGEEYEVLLKSNSTEEIVNRLGRSEMAVIVQAGYWRPKYLKWCDEKGMNPFGEKMLETIKQYIKESDEMILKQRNEKKAITRIEKINNRIGELNKKIEEQRKREQEFEYTSIGVEARDERRSLEKEKAELEEELKDAE